MTTRLRVLLLADDTGADLLLRELRRGFAAVHFARVTTVEGIRRALESPVWDVVLYAHGDLAFDVLTVLDCVSGAERPLPVVVVTGHNGAEVAATAAGLMAGVRGYVSQAELSRLVPVVQQACKDAENERQHRLAEVKLHLFAETVEAISQGILIADAQAPDFRIRYVNRAFEQMTGRAADALLGRGLRVLHRTGADAFPLKAVQAVLGEARPAEAEWRQLRPDGSECWLGGTFKPIRDERDRLTHVMAVVTDQTGRKRLEEQLRLAQKMEAVGRLVGDVAHDFNTLLGNILVHSEMLLRETPPDSHSHQNLLQLIESGARAEELARLLMNFSGRRPQAPQALDLNTVVEETLRLLHAEIGDAALTLDAGASVLADPGLLQGVVTNLVLQALDASPDGARLSVHTEDVFLGEALPSAAPTPQDGWYVLLEIVQYTDGPNGAHASRLNGTQFHPQGQGLAVVRDMVAELGGILELDHRTVTRSGVRVLLPRAERSLTVTGAPE